MKLRIRFDALDDYENVEENVKGEGHDFEKAFNEIAKEAIGFKKKGQKPWISGKSWDLVEDRRRLKSNVEQAKSDRMKQTLNEQYKAKDKEVKKSMHEERQKSVGSCSC